MKHDGYDHTNSHPFMHPHFVISGYKFLIIVHVKLSYVLSMGMPPSKNISSWKCIVTYDDLGQLFLIRTCHKVNHFSHQPPFFTLCIKGESIIGHFIPSSKLAYKPDQSPFMNMLSWSLHKSLSMKFPNNWVFEYSCKKSVLLRPSASCLFRYLHSTIGFSFLH